MCQKGSAGDERGRLGANAVEMGEIPGKVDVEFQAVNPLAPNTVKVGAGRNTPGEKAQPAERFRVSIIANNPGRDIVPIRGLLNHGRGRFESDGRHADYVAP